MSKPRFTIGQKIDRLTILAVTPSDGNGYGYLIRCDCGTEKIVRQRNIVNGRTRGCGCTWQKRAREAVTRHGKSKTAFYTVWKNMKMRCLYPKQMYYPIYGGRGIKVCERWMKFDNFLEDMEASYLEHFAANDGDTTIERIDVDGDYTPENCCWLTRAEQNRNHRNGNEYRRKKDGMGENMKRCYKCKTYKEKTNFSRNKRCADGLSNKCKTCQNEYGRKHHAARSAALKAFDEPRDL